MTPEERRQFEDMKRALNTIQRALDVSFIESVDSRLITGILDVDTSGDETNNPLIRKESVGSEGGDVYFVEYPNKWLLRKYLGKTYLVPAYELDTKIVT